MSSERNRRQASRVLLDLVCTLQPEVRPLCNWFNAVFETTEKWFQSEGNQGVKRMKDILHYGWLTILGYSPETLSWTKSNKQGVPDQVAPLVTWAKGKTFNPRLFSAILTLIRLTDLWLGRKEDEQVARSLDIIMNSRISGMARKEIERFSLFVNDFFTAYPKHPLTRAYMSALNFSDSHLYLYRESRGPSGPLTRNAHRDLVSLTKSVSARGESLAREVEALQKEVTKFVPGRESSIGVNTRFEQSIVQAYGPDWMELIPHPECPGKLSMKPEKGGKLRLVAQPDYFSQMALKPIHDWLMGLLRVVPADCTYDQRKAIPRIVKWHNQGSYVASFDQSSCTDRFPFEFQLQVIKHRFGIPMMESLQTVMADREWEIRMPSGKTRRVRWSIGQPLGMFASWPLMALSHHLLVQYSYWLGHNRKFQKGKPFNRYVVCGDDIVIADLVTAREYQRVCKRLGMVINESKSHISGGKTGVLPTSEFAKIAVVRGAPLFPLKPNLVLKAIEDKRYVIPLLVDLTGSDTWDSRLKMITTWIKRVFPKEKAYLTSLLTLPREIGGLGFRDDRSIRRLVEVHLPNIHPFLFYIAERIRAGLKLESLALTSCESLVHELPIDVLREHPLFEYINYQSSVMMRTAHLREGYIPSTYEIVCRLLVGGLGAYDRFLVDKTQPDFPVWESEEKEMRHQTIWRRVMKMKRSLKSPDTLPWLRKFLDASNFTDAKELAAIRNIEDPSWLANEQEALIKSVILAERVKSR